MTVRLCRRYSEETLKHLIGDEAAARGEGDVVGSPFDEVIAFEVGEDGMDGFDRCCAEFGAEIAEIDAAVQTQAEEPGFFEFFLAGETVRFVPSW